MPRKTILTFVHYYLPGFKSGGPVRTIANMVKHIGRDFDFKIVTADRDSRDSRCFEGVRIDDWNEIGNAHVFYCSPGNQSMKGFHRLLSQTDYDVLYLNSFFNSVFTIRPLVLRKLGLLPSKPTILAPRGELAAAALSLKRRKKTIFARFALRLDLYDNILWHASSPSEAVEIQRFFESTQVPIFVAPNLPCAISPGHKMTKQPGELKMVCVGRITPIKNLSFAIQILSHVRSTVRFDIYGPVGDSRYWRDCKKLIRDLPRNVQAVYRGEIHHSKILDVLPTYHLFFLPTMNENFGHAIFEALSVGLPVLIGNNTPWQDLQSVGAGWDLPLDQTDRFVTIIERCAKMASSEYRHLRQCAHDYAKSFASQHLVDQNRRLFLSA